VTGFERRTLLASLAGVVGLAGCSGRGPSSPTEGSPTATVDSTTPTASRTPAETATASPPPTPSPIDASDFEFVVSVVRQPSETAPGRIRASLTNRSGEERSLTGGDPLPVTATVTDGPDEALLLFPDQADVFNSYWWADGDEERDAATIDDAVYDGCWRAPAPLWSTAAGAGVIVPEGLTIAADYYPLAHSDDGCPTGSYTVGGGKLGVIVDDAAWMQPSMTVEITAERALSVSGSLSIREA
jgi:hypothetical protein